MNLTSSSFSSASMTTLNPHVAPIDELISLRTVTAILMTIIIALINLALGAAIGKVELMRQWRIPSGVLVGCIVQFVVFPLLALSISHIFKLSEPYRVGMMLVAICPGGAMANVVTFFVDGNICLSATQNLTSTIISMGYVPIVLLIMTHGATTGSLAISFWVVAIAIVVIAIPLALGVLIRSFREAWAKVVMTIGIVVGLVAFTGHSLFQVIFNSHVFRAPTQVYFATLLLPVLGFFLAFVITFLLGQHPNSRHTIAVNAVFQNTSVAILILSTSYAGDPRLSEMMVIPALYGPLSALFGIFYIIVFLTVTTSEENVDRDQATTSTTSGYVPIDESPRGKGEYAALEGDDDDVADEISQQEGRLRLKDYEVVNGSVYLKTITMPVLQ